MTIDEIDRKLKKLRKDWIKGSPAIRKFIETGAKLLKTQREKLINKKMKNEKLNL